VVSCTFVAKNRRENVLPTLLNPSTRAAYTAAGLWGDKTIYRLAARQARATPTAFAVRDHHRRLTYEELTGPGETDPPAVLELMRGVTLIPAVRRPLFGPRITVFTKNGRSFTKEGTGREFIWDFEEQARRIRPIAPGLAITRSVRSRWRQVSISSANCASPAEKLISLTIPA